MAEVEDNSGGSADNVDVGAPDDVAPAPSLTQHQAQQRARTRDVTSDAASFDALNLPPPLASALATAGFLRPSPVQRDAIPLGILGSDLIVQAKSGTGKTVVFAVVCLHRVKVDKLSVQAIIMAPTREIAVQSEQVLTKIAAALPPPAASCGVFVGGLSTVVDEKRLRRTCHIAVGTPGRMCSLVQSGVLPTSDVAMFVLDEADSLLAESFYPDITWIYDQLPRRKQVMAFSATYTDELLADLEPLMKRPQRVMMCADAVSLLGVRQYYSLVGSSNGGIDSAGGAGDATADGAAAAIRAEGTSSSSAAADSGGSGQAMSAADVLNAKVNALLALFASLSFHQAAVFCNQKANAEWVSTFLTAAGYPAAYLGADKAQTERMEAMDAVRGFKLRVLVSTDVLSRGVDLERVNLVVNLDVPYEAATYVHRVGRTGRFGTHGIAVALVTAEELDKLRGFLEEAGGGVIQPLPEVISDDWYAYELGSTEEREALQALRSAPTAEPPPPPAPPEPKLKGKKGKKQAAVDAAEAETAAVAAGGEDASYGRKAEGVPAAAARGAQQTRQEEGNGGAADGDYAEAWAAYYRDCGMATGQPYGGRSDPYSADSAAVWQLSQQPSYQSHYGHAGHLESPHGVPHSTFPTTWHLGLQYKRQYAQHHQHPHPHPSSWAPSTVPQSVWPEQPLPPHHHDHHVGLGSSHWHDPSHGLLRHHETHDQQSAYGVQQPHWSHQHGPAYSQQQHQQHDSRYASLHNAQGHHQPHSSASIAPPAASAGPPVRGAADESHSAAQERLAARTPAAASATAGATGGSAAHPQRLPDEGTSISFEGLRGRLVAPPSGATAATTATRAVATTSSHTAAGGVGSLRTDHHNQNRNGDSRPGSVTASSASESGEDFSSSDADDNLESGELLPSDAELDNHAAMLLRGLQVPDAVVASETQTAALGAASDVRSPVAGVVSVGGAQPPGDVLASSGAFLPSAVRAADGDGRGDGGATSASSVTAVEPSEWDRWHAWQQYYQQYFAAYGVYPQYEAWQPPAAASADGARTNESQGHHTSGPHTHGQRIPGDGGVPGPADPYSRPGHHPHNGHDRGTDPGHAAGHHGRDNSGHHHSACDGGHALHHDRHHHGEPHHAPHHGPFPSGGSPLYGPHHAAHHGPPPFGGPPFCGPHHTPQHGPPGPFGGPAGGPPHHAPHHLPHHTVPYGAYYGPSHVYGHGHGHHHHGHGHHGGGHHFGSHRHHHEERGYSRHGDRHGCSRHGPLHHSYGHVAAPPAATPMAAAPLAGHTCQPCIGCILEQYDAQYSAWAGAYEMWRDAYSMWEQEQPRA